MNVIKMLFVSMLTLSILVACSQDDTKDTVKKNETADTNEVEEKAGTDDAAEVADDTDTSEDKKLKAIKDKSESVKSYHAMIDMNANLDNSEEESLNLDVNYMNGEEPSFELKTYDTLRMVSVDGVTYFNNSEEWIDISDSVELNALFHVTYDQAVQYFSDVYDELERVEEDGKVTYVYEGDDGFVYNRLEQYLQVNFGTVDTSDHQTSIEFTVDEKEKVITDVLFSSEINDAEGGIEFSGEIHYDQFDEITDIELPEM